MQPKSLSFITYNNKYLGTFSKLFGFVKPSHAQQVKKCLQYEKFVVKENSTESNFIIAPPSTHLKKPLNRKHLQIQTMDTGQGLFFGTVNNMTVMLVDDVKLIKPDTVKLECNYTDGVFTTDNTLQEHLQDIYDEKEIDYFVKFINTQSDLFEEALGMYINIYDEGEEDEEDN
jgi:hypothetical protein